MSDDLGELVGSLLATALEKLVDERVAVALAARAPDHENGLAWLSLSEAASYVGVSERTVSRLISRGDLRTTTLGRRRLIAREALDAFLREAAGRQC